MDVRNLLRDQSELRTKLMKLILKKKLSMGNAAKEIGIAFNTLNGFLKQDKNIDLVPLAKVLDYIDQN